MRRKSFTTLLLLFTASILLEAFASINCVYAFGSFSNPLKSVEGVVSPKKKTGSETKVENVEDLMSGILKEILPANNIEARGREMLSDALVTVEITNKLVSDTAQISKYISDMTDCLVKLKNGERDVIVVSAENFQQQFIEQGKKHTDAINQLSSYKNKANLESQKVSDTIKPQSKGLMENPNLAKTTGPNIQQQLLGESKDHLTNIENKTNEVNQMFQGDVLSFFNDANTFEKKIEEFSTQYVRPAIEGIGFSVGFMKGLQKDFPSIIRSIEKIEKKSQKNGQALIVEGVKVLGILAIQKDKIQELIQKIKTDPLNLRYLEKLTTISIDILFFIDTINKYNTAIKKVNEQLSIAVVNIKSVQHRLRDANTHSNRILDGITNAYANALSKL